MKYKLYIENIKVALNSIRTNLLRSILTMMIIAFGIMALVGILTAIDGLIFSMSDNFSKMGANSYSIRPASQTVRSNSGGRVSKRAEPLTYDQVMEFREKMGNRAMVSLSFRGSSNATIKFENEKTNPTVRVYGVNDEYLRVSKYEISHGRAFSNAELEYGNNRAILGSDIVKDIFGGNAEKAVDKTISVGNRRFKVIGVLESRGSSMSQSADRLVFIPLFNAKRIYGTQRSNYDLAVGMPNAEIMDESISESIGILRNIRGLKAAEENDFEIRKSDGLIDILKDNTVMLRSATIAIGLITLLGAAIGLMNIMLVSVTERTREIGIRKALGATRNNIRVQFMTEAIVLCLLGGLLGIIFGIIIGNSVTLLLKSNFIIPIGWMALGISFCMGVGFISGLYPAMKAANLDPIESLRYE